MFGVIILNNCFLLKNWDGPGTPADGGRSHRWCLELLYWTIVSYWRTETAQEHRLTEDEVTGDVWSYYIEQLFLIEELRRPRNTCGRRQKSQVMFGVIILNNCFLLKNWGGPGTPADGGRSHRWCLELLYWTIVSYWRTETAQEHLRTETEVTGDVWSYYIEQLFLIEELRRPRNTGWRRTKSQVMVVVIILNNCVLIQELRRPRNTCGRRQKSQVMVVVIVLNNHVLICPNEMYIQYAPHLLT